MPEEKYIKGPLTAPMNDPEPGFHVAVDTTAGGWTQPLPKARVGDGLRFTNVALSGSNVVTLTPAGSDHLLPSGSPLTLAPGQSMELTCVSDHVWVVAGNAAGGGGSGGGVTWSLPSPLGASYRPATTLFMSTYDTNPASTDQTAAFQAAFAAATAIIQTGVKNVDLILDTRQKYSIGGAVTAGAQGQWAQIILPWSTTAKGTIRLVGMPRGADWDFLSNTSPTVIESTLTQAPAYQATRGIASTIGCGPASCCSSHIGGTTPQNNIILATSNIAIRSANPVICGIDAGFGNGFFFDGTLQFDTDALASGGALAVCTNPQAIPIIFPFFGDNKGAYGDTLVCSGWLGGPMVGEMADIRKIVVFCIAGASLYVDSSTQVTRIGQLIEWNTAWGVAGYSPTSAIPISPGASATGSNANVGGLGLTTPLKIDSWNVQTTTTGVPASTNRAGDVLDSGNRIPIDAVWYATTDAEVKLLAPTIVGVAGTTTAASLYKRIINALTAAGGIGYTAASGTTPLTPASGVAIRNPFGRDCFVTPYQLFGHTITAISVNGNPVFTSGTSPAQAGFMVMIPANATISLTYSGGTQAPTLAWTLI